MHCQDNTGGEHLGRCPFYIDLNMMRTGAVEHPLEWKHTAYHEFAGAKLYKQIVYFSRLLNARMIEDLDRFKTWYIKILAEKLECIDKQQELYWSRANAV